MGWREIPVRAPDDRAEARDDGQDRNDQEWHLIDGNGHHVDECVGHRRRDEADHGVVHDDHHHRQNSVQLDEPRLTEREAGGMEERRWVLMPWNSLRDVDHRIQAA